MYFDPKGHRSLNINQIDQRDGNMSISQIENRAISAPRASRNSLDYPRIITTMARYFCRRSP
jgi:hypothetical protein